MPRRFRPSLVIAALVCAASSGAGEPVADADCSPRSLAPALLTPPGTTLPRVVPSMLAGLVPGPRAVGMETHVVRSAGGAPVGVMRREIAPGLFRVHLSSTPAQVLVEVAASETLLAISREARPGQVPAPEVFTVLTTRGDPRSPGTVVAHMHAPVPAGAVAILARWGDEPSPTAWARVRRAEAAIRVFAPGRCDELPAGMRGPRDDQRVARFAYADALGHLSAYSEPVGVVGER